MTAVFRGYMRGTPNVGNARKNLVAQGYPFSMVCGFKVPLKKVSNPQKACPYDA